MSETVYINTKGLEQLIKALKGKDLFVKVGVLGNKNIRNTKLHEETNAVIGARHEFGTDTLPIRSFLRVPISENIQKYLSKSGVFDQNMMKKVLKEGSFLEWIKKIGLVAETIVADAFNTGGFGKWKPSDMRYKKVHQTLVETQQLRNSITSEVSE